MKPKLADLTQIATGLCASCLHARKIANDRGREFVLCERSKFDPNFARYPRLPVLQCAGYEAQ